MRPRPYADADLPLLQEALAAWIADAGVCGYGHVGDLPHRIYEDLRGRGPTEELVQVWEHRDEIAGVAINLRFGCAFDVVAAPSVRGSALELEMLRTAYETTAARLAAGDPYVLSDVFDCDTTRMDALTQLGFERFREWDDVRDRPLEDEIPAAEVPAGFRVRSARLDDADHLALARNSALGADWSGDSFRAAVMEKPGYDADRELVVEAPDGRIAAFATTWLDERNRVGHFEPVGTHREFRRRGLARAAMLEAMRRMRAAGMRAVSITHDQENVAARNLYESLGFERRYETYGYRRAAR